MEIVNENNKMCYNKYEERIGDKNMNWDSNGKNIECIKTAKEEIIAEFNFSINTLKSQDLFSKWGRPGNINNNKIEIYEELIEKLTEEIILLQGGQNE